MGESPNPNHKSEPKIETEPAIVEKNEKAKEKAIVKGRVSRQLLGAQLDTVTKGKTLWSICEKFLIIVDRIPDIKFHEDKKNLARVVLMMDCFIKYNRDVKKNPHFKNVYGPDDYVAPLNSKVYWPTKEFLLKELGVDAKSSPAKPSTSQPLPAKPSPAKPSPAKPSPKKNVEKLDIRNEWLQLTIDYTVMPIRIRSREEAQRLKNKYKLLGWVPHNSISDGYYPVIKLNSTGLIALSGGFMEADSSHGPKRAMDIIDPKTNELTKIPAARRNIGIDYLTLNENHERESHGPVKAWLGGEIIFSGKSQSRFYGNRVIVRTDRKMEFKGKSYTIYQMYSHLSGFSRQYRKGSKIN